MTTQLDLFGMAKVAVAEPEPMTEVKIGSRVARIPLRKKRREAQVRIFTDYLVAVREQEYQGYWHYLLDFRNGLWEHPIDNFRSHYACLAITRFKD